MITILSIHADRQEYSRIEPNRSVLKARIVPDEAGPVSVSLTKGGYILDTKNVDLTLPKGAVVVFDLKELGDDGFPIYTTGDYEIVATSGNVTVSQPFHVSLMTVENFKRSYCAGLPLRQVDVVAALKQPSLIKGVTINSVSSGTMPGLYLLSYKTAAGQPDTLQWNNGALVEIAGTTGTEILPDETGNYIEVTIDRFELPVADAAEGIILDHAAIDDAAIRQEIRNAIAEIERCVGTFLEPKRAATAPYFDASFDVLAQTAHFFRREAFSKMSLSWRVNLPYTHVQKMIILEGFFGGQKVLELQHGIFALNHISGSVEILPQAAELSYIITFFTQLNYWGIRESITDFWRYQAIIGLNDIDKKADLLKAVGYTAAIPILTIAGQAARGGRQSESFSKDGVSRSSSFAQTGVYGSTIDQCTNWLKGNKSSLRTRYGGFVSTTL